MEKGLPCSAALFLLCTMHGWRCLLTIWHTNKKTVQNHLTLGLIAKTGVIYMAGFYYMAVRI